MAFSIASLLPWGASLVSGMLGGGTKTQQKAQTGTTSVVGSGNSASVGTSQQVVDQTNQTGTSQTGSASTKVSRLGGETESLLTQQLNELFRVSNGIDVREDELARIGDSPAAQFNADDYISAISSSADARLNEDLESGINQMRGRIGASSSTNSAAALMEDKMRRNALTQSSAIKAEATAKAAQLGQNLSEGVTSQKLAITGAGSQELQGLLGGLLQANETQSTMSTSTGEQNTTQKGTTSTSESTAVKTNENQRSTENMNISLKDREGTAWSGFFDTLGKAFGAKF